MFGRRKRARSSGGGGQLARAMLGLLVVVAPQALGGLFAWTTAALGVAACVALAVALWQSRHVPAPDFGGETMVWLFAVVLLVTVAHATPLPSGWIEWLSPAAAENLQAVARGLGLPAPAWMPFTLDPGRTAERVLYAIAVLIAFCGARLVSATSNSTPLLMFTAASTALIALSHLGHRLLQEPKVFGLYLPSEPGTFGPLINYNNMAGFMAFGAPLCVGLALRARDASRWLWFVAATVTSTTCLLAASRAGPAVLAIGLLTFAAFQVLGIRKQQKRHEQEQSTHERGPSHWVKTVGRTVLLLALLVAFGTALANLTGDAYLDTNYQDLTKLDLYRSEWEMLANDAKVRLLGVGRGSFAPAFTRIFSLHSQALYAESLPFQYAIEFGVPISILFFGTAIWRLQQGFRGWRSPAHAGAMAGIFALICQNLADFSLELSGIAVPAAVCLGAALPNARRRAPSPARGLFDLRRSSYVCLGAAVMLLSLFAKRSIETDSVAVTRALQSSFTNEVHPEFWGLAQRSIQAHPADANITALIAAEAVIENRSDSGFWLNRSMRLAPDWAAPHLWSAEWLFGRGAEGQAFDEVRSAAELDPLGTAAGLCHWLQRNPTASAALRMTPSSLENEASTPDPETSPRVVILDAAARCLTDKPNESAVLDAELVSAVPTHLGAAARRSERALKDHDWNAAVFAARQVERGRPNSIAGYSLEAQALSAQGHNDTAAALIEGVAERVDNRYDALQLLARMYALAGNETALRRTIDQLRLAAAGDLKKLVAANVLLGYCEATLGNDAQALRALREAESMGAGPEHLAAIATLAARLGRLEYALSKWQQLCDAVPPDSQACAESTALKSRIGAAP